jgi:hypothetical protein
MKRWLPDPIYRVKPWALISVGILLTPGMMIWSWLEGSWEPWRSILCFLGAAGAIGGGAILQLRQEYRNRSKWNREHTKLKADPRTVSVVIEEPTVVSAPREPPHD